jgi:hypothetical protein
MSDPVTRFLELSPEDQDYLRNGLISQLLRVPLLGRAHEVLVRAGLDGSGNAWEAIRTSDGDFAGYLSDIQRVWAAVERTASRDDGLGAASTCIWYAALLASQVSRATTLPPPFAFALCTHGVWSGAAGVSYALRLPQRTDRGAFLAALRPLLSADLAARVDPEIRALGSDGATRPESDTCWEVDRSTCERTRLGDRFTLNAELLEAINALDRSPAKRIEMQLGRARRLAKKARDRGQGAAGLAEIALNLQRYGDVSRSVDMWDYAIEYADRSKKKRERVLGLRQILARLAPSSSWFDPVLRRAHAAATALANASERAEALLRLAATMPEAGASSLIDEAVVLADTIKTPTPHTQLLVLASRVTRGLRSQQITARAASRLLDIPERATRMQMCLELVGQLDTADTRAALLRAVVRETRTIRDSGECVRTLGALAVGKTGRLEAHSVADVLSRLRGIKDGQVRSYVLQRLAPALTAAQRKMAYKLAVTIRREDRYQRGNMNGLVATAIWAVARHADEPERTAHWKQAWDLHSAKGALAADAPAEYRGEVWRTALATRFNGFDREAIVHFRDELDLEAQVEHWEAARASIIRSSEGGLDGVSKNWFIRTWVPERLFADELARERERLIRAPGGDAYSNRSCVAELFRNASEPCLATALAFARGIPDADLRLYLLEPLAERMKAEGALIAGLALAALDEIEKPHYCLDDLVKVAGHLAPADRDELLTRIREYLPRASFRPTRMWSRYLESDPAPTAELVDLAWRDWERLRGQTHLGRENLALELYPHLDAVRARECEPDLRFLAQGKYDLERAIRARVLLGDENPRPAPLEEAWQALLREAEPIKALEALVARIVAGDSPARPMSTHVWQALLRRHALAGREKLLKLLHTVADAIEIVVGPRARAEAYAAIADVMAWWE